MTPAETASVVGQVLQGLDASHQQGIIHRDLKPENILFGADGMAKIADYGIAADVKNRQTRRNWMGLVNEVFATVVYAPPEQTNQRKAFHVYETNDIFAFGVILFEMLTQGQFPFGSEEDFAKDMGVTYQQRKEAGDWNRKLLAKHAPDPKWVGMMEKCLHPDPKMRFQRAGDMLAALGEVPLTPLKTREGNRKPGAWQLQVMSGDEIGRGYNLSNLLHYQHKKLLALGWFDAGNPYVNDVGIVEQHTTFISSRHATLEMEDLGGGVQQWYIRDGQFYEKNGQRGFHASTNGVLVNSQRVPPGAAERLQDGDIITVGDTTLKVIVG
jgi:serine/threonine protein kinase